MAQFTGNQSSRNKAAGFVSITLESGKVISLAVSEEHPLASLTSEKTLKVVSVTYAPRKQADQLDASDFA